MIIGFTGGREAVTDRQLGWLYQLFEDGKRDGTLSVMHHGACIGADAAAHYAALDNEMCVVVHPPTNLTLVARECLRVDNELVTVLPRQPYLMRNREIVGATKGLIALPTKPEGGVNEGGTWYTVHFAERMMKPVLICYTDGRVEERWPPKVKGVMEIW